MPRRAPGLVAPSSRPLPEKGDDTPDTWEHSDEVQVPFLQQTLRGFTLLPIVLGDVDAAAVARGLAGIMDEQTLVIASSDLSHYHPYARAKELDLACVKSVCNLDLEAMQRQEACGQGPILAVMHLAANRAGNHDYSIIEIAGM